MIVKLLKEYLEFVIFIVSVIGFIFSLFFTWILLLYLLAGGTDIKAIKLFIFWGVILFISTLIIIRNLNKINQTKMIEKQNKKDSFKMTNYIESILMFMFSISIILLLFVPFLYGIYGFFFSLDERLFVDLFTILTGNFMFWLVLIFVYFLVINIIETFVETKKRE